MKFAVMAKGGLGQSCFFHKFITIMVLLPILDHMDTMAVVK